MRKSSESELVLKVAIRDLFARDPLISVCLPGREPCTEGPGNTSGTVQIAASQSSTLAIGKKSTFSCLEMTDGANTANIDYLYPSSTAWVLTQTKPNFCQ
jgi:hypothetical protein